MVTNHFDSEIVAARYARARPAFHEHVMRRLEPLLTPFAPLGHALDVGCGTGDSTTVLARFAEHVVGVDPSLPMLQHVQFRDGTSYIAGRGEELPFRDGAFDLLTTSLAFHWLDRARFLGEAVRILRPVGLLIVYDNYFSGRTVESDDLIRWIQDVYRIKYPAPPRAPLAFELGQTAEGFRCLHHDEYSNQVVFTHEELTEYLLTQTNVIAAASGDTSIEVVERWLKMETRHFFKHAALTIQFGGPIYVLKRE